LFWQRWNLYNVITHAKPHQVPKANEEGHQVVRIPEGKKAKENGTSRQSEKFGGNTGNVCGGGDNGDADNTCS